MEDESSIANSTIIRGKGLLARAFSSCEGDPKGSVHRAWGVSLLLIVVFFVVALTEVLNLQKSGASKALAMAAVWTAAIHFLMAIAGTFILKRFPTSFSVGFFLGLVVVVAQQNLLLFVTFHSYSHGSSGTNRVFAVMALGLSFVYMVFGAVLAQFREHIMIASAEVKGLGGSGRFGNNDSVVSESGRGSVSLNSVEGDYSRA